MFRNQFGQSLVEVIVAIAILAVGGSAVIIMILGSLRGADLGGQQSIASAYAREGAEAVKSIASSAFNTLEVGTYALTETENVWGLTPGSDTNGIYTRTIEVAEVHRNEKGDIVTSGGTVDIGTRKVVTTVTWQHAGGTRTYEITNYVTYWDSLWFFENTFADFFDGTFVNTEASADGAVRLGAVPGGVHTSGTYVSSVMDGGQAGFWNAIKWTPGAACLGSSLQLQIRTAMLPEGLDFERWQGPDGEDADETDFYTETGTIHSSHDGDRYLQYRATFGGPGTCTPELEEVEIAGTAS